MTSFYYTEEKFEAVIKELNKRNYQQYVVEEEDAGVLSSIQGEKSDDGEGEDGKDDRDEKKYEANIVWMNLRQLNFEKIQMNCVINHLQGSQHFSNKVSVVS